MFFVATRFVRLAQFVRLVETWSWYSRPGIAPAIVNLNVLVRNSGFVSVTLLGVGGNAISQTP